MPTNGGPVLSWIYNFLHKGRPLLESVNQPKDFFLQKETIAENFLLYSIAQLQFLECDVYLHMLLMNESG